MDVRVEATIHLNQFQDKTEVLQILRSHGFQLSDLGEGQVHVRGYFSKLKAVKVRLEQLIEPQTKTTLRSPSPSSGAISKYYNKDSRGRSQSRDKPPHPSPSSPSSSSEGASKLNCPTSQDYAASSSSPDRHASVRTRHETVVVDADVFRYAERLRKRDIDSIQDSHQVRIQVQENSSSSTITLQGRSSKSAAGELQKLLDDLNISLRTQEVPLRDMDRDGKALLEEIRRNQNIFGSVLVCQMEDRLHLIGLSVESYEVKQRLLGRQIRPSERPGRPFNRNLRNRSSSLPPNSRKNTESRSNPPPGGAAAFSSSRNQEDKPEAADAPPKSAASRGRSNSETRGRKGPERANYFEPQRESSSNPPHGGAAGFSSSGNQEDKPEAAAGNPRSRTSRTRSQSEPRRPKGAERETDFNPRPGGATGFSSTWNQEDKPEAADAPPKSEASKTRSESEPRRPKEPERTNDIELKRGNKLLPSKSRRSFFQRLFSWKFLPLNLKKKQ
ncbi:serine/arginine repetitive matrix protein 2-like [Amphiprion ocellaris]|uniref:serine/arginine repetitive matrix protein 2-like n=1 Tax=Amphiprion ocellaris TaxID=80972 RepID=UPI0024111BC0|nr:serine/arginine repetitive matrix protein 2-like [Amphiprion ocellaris]